MNLFLHNLEYNGEGEYILREKIRVGIVGYGKLGRGVEIAIKQNTDMELVAIFTRRPVNSIRSYDDIKILDVNISNDYVNDIDVMILCGGSATDLPIQGPYFASMYNTVDSYDNHGNIPEYLNAMNKASMARGKTSAACIGWDPGLFSMNRVLFDSILSSGTTYTFWGPGVSQGHSDAIRRIAGVKNAVQYTIPNEEVVRKIRSGETPKLATRDRHVRWCYVAVEKGADKNKIENEIKAMPNYFADYDTKVIFIDEEEIQKDHSKTFHGGFVIKNGRTGEDCSTNHTLEFSLKLDSNSEFTASILVAYARAVYRLNKEGNVGAKTVFDIPLKYLSIKSIEDLCKGSL